MTWAIWSFALGVYWLQQQAVLPDAELRAILAAIASVTTLAAFWRPLRLLLPVATFLVGIVWAGYLAQARLDDALSEEIEGRDVTVVGVIAELPQAFDNGVRFDFDVEQAPVGIPQHVALGWYRGFRGNEDEEAPALPDLRAGQRWRVTVRLKRPHGNVNPYGYDYEAALFERGVRATGYVRVDPANAKLDDFVRAPGYAVERVRQTLRDRMLAALPQQSFVGVLIALAIGDQHAIDSGLWRVFANTGLTHLMSISGLHVTMVASIAYFAIGWSWRRWPGAALRLPAQLAAALGGLAGAYAYCLIAGFQVPAQRTLYMLAAVAAALWSGRNVGSLMVLSFGLLVVLLIDPWAVFAAGFWLSFGAVAVLLFSGGGRVDRPHWLREWLTAQWAVTVGMIPALLALFQQFSLVSPFANAAAIPLVGLVITPLTLLGCVAPAPVHEWLLWLADALMALLMLWVNWLAALPWAVWQQAAPPSWAILPALVGMVWMLMPRGFPARWVGATFSLPLLFTAPARPPPGAADVVVVDVGEGLAVHVQTASHDMLFDTGPQFSAEANSGNRILLPYLRAVGVRRLDALLVSHHDSDHAGGAKSILEAMPVAQMIDSLAPDHELHAFAVPHRACVDGLSWTWDEVRFDLLHPAAESYAEPPRKGNDMSCVLRISSASGSVLLTGDIETWSERRLLATHAADLKSDVVLPPHHGSRSSSSPDFVNAVAASTVVIAVGYRNRFHHPDPGVLARYRETSPRLLRTDTDGAATVRLRGGGIDVVRQRQVKPRYWQWR